MAMINAERQRKYRLNRDRDQQKRAAYLQNEKKKYITDKTVGKKKLIIDMTDREKRSARKKWRQTKKKYRALQKEQLDITPLASSGDDNAPGPSISKQQKVSTRKRNREVAKCYRDNIRLKSENTLNRKKAELYRKRWTRELNRHKKPSNETADTPRSKTRKLLKYYPKKTVRKTLVFHHALIDQIKASYKAASKESEKHSIAQVLSGSVLRKYKAKYTALRYCGISAKKTSINPRGVYTCLSRRAVKYVRDFYERDDNSRVTTGIKNTVTSRKIKKQRRILNDSIIHLYARFQTEITFRISYTTFCRLRPFWVLFPTDSDRNTCLCKLCDNTQFMITSLKKVGATDTADLDKLVEANVCDSKRKECMYGECIECGGKELGISIDKLNEETQWSEWTIKKENRTVRSEEKEVSFTVKQSVAGSVGKLVDKFQDMLKKYKQHVYNVRSQFKYFKDRKDSIQENEAIIHIDYSENYVCKLATEVQSMHFGASKKQITLHTGIYHTHGNKSGQTFCTVSDELHHGPAAVWAHLHPVLSAIRQNPKVKHVEIFSDGPTTQYKQKGNFYLFSTEIYDMGFVNATWNFFEPGHGKGTPDAVGGSLKRSADQRVKYGTDITSAKVFVEAVKDSRTKIHEICDKEIALRMSKLDNTALKTVSGTMKIRQVLTNRTGRILHRELSCTCQQSCECNGHRLKEVEFVIENTNKEASNRKRKCAPGSTGRKAREKVIKRRSMATSKGRYVLARDVDMLVNTGVEVGSTGEVGTEDACWELDVDSVGDIGLRGEVGTEDVSAEVDVVQEGIVDIHVFVSTVEEVVSTTEGVVDGEGDICVGTVVDVGDTGDLAIEWSGEGGTEGIDREVDMGGAGNVAMGGEVGTEGIGKEVDIGGDDNVAMGGDVGIEGVGKEVDIVGDGNVAMGGGVGTEGIGKEVDIGGDGNVAMGGKVGTEGIGKEVDIGGDGNVVMGRDVGIEGVGKEVGIVGDGNVAMGGEVGTEGIGKEVGIGGDSNVAMGGKVGTEGIGKEVDIGGDGNIAMGGDVGTEGIGKEVDIGGDGNVAMGGEVRTEGIGKEVNIGGDGNVAMGGEVGTEGIGKDVDIGGDGNVAMGGEVGTEGIGEEVDIGGDGNAAMGGKVGTEGIGKEVDIGGDGNVAMGGEVGTEGIGKEGAIIKGTYVIVNYQGTPYPGYVEKCSNNEIFVECMKRVGKDFESNRFCWPKRIKDKCWYELSDILAVIPKPQPIEKSNHYQVESVAWSMATLRKLE